MAAAQAIGDRDLFRPKRRLGQHFLREKGIIHEIIARGRFSPSDRVLEIGAGFGELTVPLSGTVHEIRAVEKDPYLTRTLKKRLERGGIHNVILINEDVLKLDFDDIFPASIDEIKVIGNLPYNISSPFLEKLMGYRNLVSRAILMFQYEFAKRLVALPGNRSYGAMSIFIQYYTRVSPIMEISKDAFYPSPKVSSMVLELDLKRPHPRKADDEEHFKMIVKGAFAHRRKTLLNSLKGALPPYGKDEILGALTECAIDPERRAETLDMDEFLCLSSALKPQS